MKNMIMVAAISLFSAVVFAGSASAKFLVVDQSALFDPSTGTVDFSIQFNEVPQFTTRDSLGRLATSFQFYVFGDSSLSYPERYDSIVRGEEINTAARTLPIRNSIPPISDPAAGGWGSIRGVAPYSLDGTILNIEAPLSVLSNHSENGIFSYDLQLFEYGGLSDSLTGASTVVSEPPSLVILAAGVFAFGLLQRRSPVSYDRLSSARNPTNRSDVDVEPGT